MKPVGRNDPCPCGSGKKYKRCCLDRAGSVGAYTGAEREAALDGLFRFAARAGLEEERATADLAFWGELPDELSADELKEAMSLEQSQLGFQEWYVFDLALADGRTFLERYLERAQHRPRSGELRFLERMRRSHIRPYEVRAVRPEEGLELLDLWTRRRLRVRERLATRRLARWDVLSARVILDSRGEPVVEGSPYLYPPEAPGEGGLGEGGGRQSGSPHGGGGGGQSPAEAGAPSFGKATASSLKRSLNGAPSEGGR